jgi:hypothetical protein
VGLKSLKSLNLTNGYPNKNNKIKNNNNNNNKVKSKPLELRSRVKNDASETSGELKVHLQSHYLLKLILWSATYKITNKIHKKSSAEHSVAAAPVL